MNTDATIHRFYGRVYANETLWTCLSCLEGLLDETIGFIHTPKNPGPAKGTSMADLSSRIVGEARTHTVSVKNGNTLALKETGLYELSIPQVSPCSPVAIYSISLLTALFRSILYSNGMIS